MPRLFELHDRARERGIEGFRRMSRDELLAALGDAEPAAPAPAAGPTEVDVTRDGGLGLLTLRGAVRENTLALETLEQLAAAAEELAADTSVRVVGVTARGRIFSAGADLTAIAGLGGEEIARRGADACERLASLPLPTVALLNGHAVGGAIDVVLACDWRVALPGVKLRFIHNELGYTPPWGAAARVAQLMPPGRALGLFALCRTVAASEARELGLVDEVIEGGERALLDHARGLAARAGHASREAVAETRRLLRERPPLEQHGQAFAALWDAARIPGGSEEDGARERAD